jgi:diguanylate cyclase (GGDEF)-like protein
MQDQETEIPKPLPTLPATMEIDGTVRLIGRLSWQGPGQLLLAKTRVLDDTPSFSKLHVPPVRDAVLNLGSLRDNLGFIDNIDVRVIGTNNTDLSLEFRTPDGEREQRLLPMLPGYDNSEPCEEEDETSSEPLEADQILALLRDQSTSGVETLLKRFLIDLCNHLFDLSARSKQHTSGENLHYEAMNAVKKNGMKMIATISSAINADFDDPTSDKTAETPESAQAETTGKLGLVDLKEFEDNLTIGRLIDSGVELYSIPLECLTIRMAQLLDQDPLSIKLPMHVAQLVQAFYSALQSNGIPVETMPDIYDYLGHNFLRDLDKYYESLNQLLRDHSVAPELEETLRTEGSLLYKPESSSRFGNTDPVTEHLRPEEQAPEPAQATPDIERMAIEKVAELAEQLQDKLNDKFSPDSLYQSVIEALNFKRDADGLKLVDNNKSTGYLSTAEAPAQLADARSIADVLGEMQTDKSRRSEVHASASLREYLANNQSTLLGLQGTSGLSADSLNQLDLVDNMFGSINSHMDVNTQMKPVLGDLQIPMARLALTEPQFFLDRSHPARGLMDKLAKLTASANFPNKALETRIERVIDQIVSNYENDSEVFESALGEVEKLVNQQERALSRNVDRVVKTQQGNEKLRLAQREVAQVLNSRITPPTAPSALVKLIDGGWRDLLIITHIKEGPESQAWHEHIKTMDLLVQWLDEQTEGIVDEYRTIQRGLEAEPLIDMIDQQISAALPTNIDHESALAELRETLSGRMPIELVEVAATEVEDAARPGKLRNKIESLPRLRRWIHRVEQLETGTWLSYKDSEGKKKRMQLAWISDDKDRYIFVNERGQKNADLGAVQLARQLGRGVQPPPSVDKMSLIDRSMFDTLENVQKSLSFDKNHDSLTKLINRAMFIDQMNRAFRHAQRKGTQHAVLYLNIDKFSLVNDIYDNVNGDHVLIEFARLLSQLHGRKTSSARLEGDEFAVLLLDRDLEQAEHYAQKIRSDIESSSIEIDGERVSFTVSIGIAPIVDYCEGVDEIINSAREAMQAAKQLGRNRVETFSEDSEQTQRRQRVQAETRREIKQTIETDRFMLRAQPIVQTRVEDNAEPSLHYELLLGLAEPDGTLSSPQEFIENAERYGYMTEVDRWVVREAFKWISHLIDSQKVIPNISINLSGTSVTDDAFLEYLLEQISEFGVGTNRLCFEITETGTISNLVKAADFVRTLRNIGCKFSIDDFGTGLASHNYLRELPVDYVKIDGTFITSIVENRNDYAMARSINDLAHFLGQETIAESVENDAIIDTLKEIGVDYLQGWGIGKPKLLADVTEDLKYLEK